MAKTVAARPNPNVTAVATVDALGATVARPMVRLTVTVATVADWERDAAAAWTAALWCAAGAWDYERGTPVNPVLRAAVCDTIHEDREEI